jgi:hypothetical protein
VGLISVKQLTSISIALLLIGLDGGHDGAEEEETVERDRLRLSAI